MLILLLRWCQFTQLLPFTMENLDKSSIFVIGYRCHERIPWKVAEFLSDLAIRGGVAGDLEKCHTQNVSDHKYIPSRTKNFQVVWSL